MPNWKYIDFRMFIKSHHILNQLGVQNRQSGNYAAV